MPYHWAIPPDQIIVRLTFFLLLSAFILSWIYSHAISFCLFSFFWDIFSSVHPPRLLALGQFFSFQWGPSPCGTGTKHSCMASALLSAFLGMCYKNWALFPGQPTLCPAPWFGLGAPATATIRYTWPIFQILGGFSDVHTLDIPTYIHTLGCFTGVFKVNLKIWSSWFVWLCRVFWVKRGANYLPSHLRKRKSTRLIFIVSWFTCFRLSCKQNCAAKQKYSEL